MKPMRILLLEAIGPILQKSRQLSLPLRGFKNISKTAVIERGVRLDRVYPQHIYIGDRTLVASDVTILCHEHVYRDPINPELPLLKKTTIGKRCFIGVSAMILPGVTIGDDCIIGAASVVAHDIPAGSVAVGVPARVIRSNVKLNDRAIEIR